MLPGTRSTACSVRSAPRTRPSSRSGRCSSRLTVPSGSRSSGGRCRRVAPPQPTSPVRAVVVRLLHAGQDRRRQRVQLEHVQGLVQPRQQRRRAVVTVEGQPTQDVAHLAHRRGRDLVVPADVADGQHGGAGQGEERVVPVAAYLGSLLGRLVAHGDVQRIRCRRLREQRPLQRPDSAWLACAASRMACRCWMRSSACAHIAANPRSSAARRR